ncbi:14-alpha sterol demethylase [Aspergillus taichungensis]|uniref:sterol 14alpha-demethylase n=1 Tax=Aspergillus taichungensis TaxID=482145 RepID=A0A2J5HWB8_9EURO|nr:14-alpha sterol demethylase [Aspergillus taichungensis]
MPFLLVVPIYAAIGALVLIVLNVARQLLFRNPKEPPVVFHWVPFLGSTIAYGIDPYAFFFSCRKKYGDIFTFTLLGQKTTVYLGIQGNEFILNGKLKDVNAEEIYRPLTAPVFGSDVVYDCPNSKFMEQKKFVKYGLTQSALESHVSLIEKEVLDYLNTSPKFHGPSGTVDVSAAMAEITIFTAARALQGEEVRSKLTAEFADLYHDLDNGFKPINFMLPWAPLPGNRKRDAAHARMREIYTDIIQERRRAQQAGTQPPESEQTDMIWNLMRCTYKDGQRPVPDKEIAHMMITLLMAGQHSSASIGAWIMLRLASEPHVVEELYREQMDNLARADTGRADGLPPLQYRDLEKLPLHNNVIKETLRLHLSIHSLMRKVMNPLPVPGTPYIVPTSHVLLASPGATGLCDEFFPDAQRWDPHRWDNRTEKQDENGEDEMVDYGYGRVSKGTSSPYLPFGAGRHRCIGEKFAYVNLGVIIATIVRNLKLVSADGSRGVVPATDYSSMFSGPVKPAVVAWERRFPGEPEDEKL